MDRIWEEIKKLADSNNGYIKTGQVEAAGISRPMLKKYKDKGYIEPVRKGLYILEGEITDEFMLLQLQSRKVVYSYGTALYLWGLSDRTPHYINVTLPQGSNVTRLKRDNPYIRFHYVMKDIYEMGITDTVSPQGNRVKLYDKERCICDIIKDKDEMDMQIFKQAVKEYFMEKPNLRKLIKYSKTLGIEEKVRTYAEVL